MIIIIISCCNFAQAFFDLENSNQELKSDLKDLYINNAMYDNLVSFFINRNQFLLLHVSVIMVCFIKLLYSQLDVTGNRKAVVIHVPYRLRKAFKKIHVRLVRELEKKFSGKVLLFL